MMENVEKAFNGLGRTKKVEFISKNIELASSSAVADYVKGYLFDVLKDVDQGGRIKMRSPPKVLTGNFRPSQLSFFLS